MKAVRMQQGQGQGRRAVLAGGAGVALSSALRPVRPARAVDVGQAAPKFTLPKSGGGEVSLADLMGSNKYSVVYFYNQDGSPGCSVEAARFQQGLPEFEKRKAQVVGISMDSLAKHDEACIKGSLTFPLLSDNTGEVSKSYGADLSIPILGKFSDRQTFLVDESGTVVGHWLEKDFSMKSVKAPLGPGSHVQQILDAIDALG